MSAPRGVLHDITLDGYTFTSSHKIAKRPWVGEFGFGLSIKAGPWKFAVARNLRTREFVGQKDRSSYGGITLVREIP